MDGEGDETGVHEALDEHAVGALERHPLHTLADQQVAQLGDTTLVVANDALDGDASGLVDDARCVCLTRPVHSCIGSHRASIEVGAVRADQKVPLRMLIGRPSVGRRPVAALGASHRREALVSRGPSARQATLALSRRWSASLWSPTEV